MAPDLAGFWHTDSYLAKAKYSIAVFKLCWILEDLVKLKKKNKGFSKMAESFLVFNAFLKFLMFWLGKRLFYF